MKKLGIFLLIISGCCRNCDFEPPPLEIPLDWQTPAESEGDGCFVWWEELNDPTLNYLMEKAALQNLDMKIGALRVLQARAQANGRKGDLYPRIDGSFTSGNISYHKKAFQNVVSKCCLPKENFSFFEIGFDAEWEIDFFGKTACEIAALKADVEALEEDLSFVWVTLSSEVAKNYIELKAYQEKRVNLEAQVELKAESMALNLELKKRGLINSQVFNEIAADLSTSRAGIFEIDDEISRRIFRLSVLLGYNPGDLTECLSSFSNLPDLPCSSPVGAPSCLLQRRPDIQKAEWKLAAATARTKSAIAALFPRISLWGFVGDITTRAGSFLSPSSFTAAAGPQILMPIFNSRLLLQDVEYSRLSTQEALYSYQKTVLEAIEEAESGIAGYLSGKKQLEAFEEAYLILDETLRNEKIKQERGLKSTLSLIEVQMKALLAKNLYTKAKENQLLRYIALYKALGGFWKCVKEQEESPWNFDT